MDITGRKFSDIIKEAEEKGIQIVLLEEGAEIGKHAALIAAMSKKDNVLLLPISSLSEEDQAKITIIRPEERDFLKEIMDNTHTKIMSDIRQMTMDVDVVLSEPKGKYFHHPLPKSTKPPKGYSGNFKANFKGRKRH